MYEIVINVFVSCTRNLYYFSGSDSDIDHSELECQVEFTCKMSCSSKAQPAKRIRLCESTQESTNCNTNCNEEKRGEIFEWDEKSIQLLSFGYARNNIEQSFQVNGISCIIFKYVQNMLMNYHINNTYSELKYMNNNSIICTFKSRYETTIIFTPYIFSLFNNNTNNNNKTKNNNKETIKMKIKLDKPMCHLNCYSKSNMHRNYFVHCGIICVPKTSIDSKFNLKKLKNEFDQKSFFLCNIPSNIKNDCVPFNDCKLKCYFACLSDGDGNNVCCLGHNTKYISQKYNYCLTQNESSINVCIDRQLINDDDSKRNSNSNINSDSGSDGKKPQYVLYFEGNDINDDIKFGNHVKLDYENYDWLFAISSQLHHCLHRSEKVDIKQYYHSFDVKLMANS